MVWDNNGDKSTLSPKYFHLFGILKIHNNLTKKHDIVLKHFEKSKNH